MLFYSLLSFFAFIVYMFLGIYALSKDRKSPLNRSFFHICMALAIWAIAYVFIYPTESKTTVMNLILFSYVGVVFLPGFLLRFVTYFAYKKDHIHAIWGPIVFYGPSVILLIVAFTSGHLTVSDVTWTKYGWIESLDEKSIWMWSTLFYYILYFGISTFILIIKLKKTKSAREKKQAKNILLSIIVSLILSLTPDIFMPLLNIYYLPSLAPIFSLIFAFIIGYTITKYQFMKLTPEIAIEQIISQIDNMIILINQEYKIISVNNEFVRVTNYTSSHLYGYNFDKLLTFDDAHKLNKILSLNKYHNEPQTIEINIIPKNMEEKIPIRLSINAIDDNKSKDLLGFVIIGIDLRQEKHINELEKDKEIQVLKSKFITMASHEFRTPLSTIMLSVDILQRHHSKLSIDKRENYFKQIKLAIYRLIQLMDEILLVEKSATGNLKLERQNVDIVNIIDKIIEEYTLTSGDKYQIIYYRPKENRIVSVDEKLIRNIVYNLLSNSIKYTPKGGIITFKMNYLSDTLEIIIQDNGNGIAQKDIPHLFEQFYRGENIGNISGTGLGLSIVKDAVDLHGGTIEIDSVLDQGTTFKVIIPI